MDAMANGLLALGASPAMIHSTDELADAIKVAASIKGVVSINIGTLDEHWIRSFKKAVECCKETGTPWVLDPVAAGFTALRTDTARELMAIHPPAVIRGNSSEIMALAGDLGAAGKGVDSTAGSDAALEAAKLLVKAYGSVVCVSGAVDYILARSEDESLSMAMCPHGVEMLTKVTAMGCLVTSVIAAFLVARPEGTSPAASTAAAMTYFNISAEMAMLQGDSGPGSFRSNFLDQLYSGRKDTWLAAGRSVQTKFVSGDVS